MRVEGFAPASTGWLIVSIFFANKLWISDAISMSRYWVASIAAQTGARCRRSPTYPALARVEDCTLTCDRGGLSKRVVIELCVSSLVR
jgi:hypothetical protein